MQNELEPNYAFEKKRNREIIYLLIFTIVIFSAQSYYAFIYSNNFILRNDNVMQIIIRLSTWTLPVFIYLIISKTNPFDYLKLQRNVLKGFMWGIIISILIALYNIVGAYLLKGHIRFNFYISNGLWWKAIILVGFSEEVLFRGFLLQKIAGISKFWVANIINAVLFVLVHFPGWIFLHQFIMPNILTSIGYIFLFGLIQGLVLKRTNSLWACMLIHSCNNFLSFALI